MDNSASLDGFLDSNDLFLATFRDSPVAMALTDAKTDVMLDVNRAYEQESGRSRQEFIGRNANDVNVWADLGQRDALVRQLSESGEFHTQPVSYYNAKCELRHGLASGRVVEIKGRKCLLFQILDVTEKTLADNALLESQRKFEFLFKHSPLAMTLNDAQTGMVLDVNPALERVLGYTREEMLGRAPIEIGHWANIEDRSRILKRLQTEPQVLGEELTFLTKNREPRIMHCSFERTEWDGDPVIVTTLEDVTEITKAEETNKLFERELAQARKLEALGLLAGGIAHDFNNILAGILGNVELLKLKDNLGEVPRKRVDAIGAGSLRARDLVRKILLFSRQQSQRRQSISLASVISEALTLMIGSVPKNITVDFTPGLPETLVQADPSQIHEVIMNLGSNAIQAIGESDGRITIALESLVQDDGKRVVEIVFGDTGRGIDQKILPRIFDPFFTTKSQGSGTGLGLSVVHGIVQEHGGTITVESSPGNGTTFRLRFPVAETATEVEAENPDLLKYGSGEKILLIDDESSVLEAVGSLLEYLGYSVIRCSSPVDAIETLVERGSTFDLVISDLSMPTMSGIDLAHRLTEMNFKIPFILLTGYMNTVNSDLMNQAEIFTVLSKPVQSHELSREVSRALEEFRKTKERPLRW